MHYRTARNFASNLRIIVNVNEALGDVLEDMGSSMVGIDGDLRRVRKNLDLMEDMYETVFRKVNRLIA